MDELERIDAYWRAANYLSAGQIYLMDNPLLWEPLAAEHIKPRLLGHWGTCPGLNLMYAHVNRLIRAHEQSTIFICGPGHGGPAMIANAYLEGTFSEIYPDIEQSEAGLGELMRRFSFPGGIASHVGPEVPGSIHEGGELGYALAHAYGAAFDNPDLLVCCVFDTTGRAWNAVSVPVNDADLSVDGRVMEILSEHLCQGWLEGYLLTGRHGVFNSYEAFVHIIDSMFNQHAKWLKLSRELAWREPVASLNYLLASHLWRQDHNGFSHQDPGFLDLVATKKAEIIRIYLPPDANTLLAVADHCLRSRHLVNVVVAAKNDVPVWLSPGDAMDHCSRGIGAWDWAGAERADTPDVVLACAGDVPTMETLAAAELLRTHLPDLAFRVVNVVDLMRLQPDTVHPHGLPDGKYDDLFPPDRPTVFAFHGYPSLVHTLAYRRANHEHLHVRGYQEEGTTTTPFDMVMRNDLDRFHLVMDVIDRVPGLSASAADVREEMVAARRHAVEHTREYGDDVPEIRDWTWAAPR